MRPQVHGIIRCRLPGRGVVGKVRIGEGRRNISSDKSKARIVCFEIEFKRETSSPLPSAITEEACREDEM